MREIIQYISYFAHIHDIELMCCKIFCPTVISVFVMILVRSCNLYSRSHKTPVML